MRRSLACGSLLTACLTYGTVSSGTQLAAPLPFWTFQGFFQGPIFRLWRLWSFAHGWPDPGSIAGLKASHPDEFGQFLAHAVYFAGPVLGFLAFLLIARPYGDREYWKPLAIALAFTTPLGAAIRDPLISLGLNTAAAETARALIVLALMAWSIWKVRPETHWWRASIARTASLY